MERDGGAAFLRSEVALDFLARWKAKKYFIYSEGAIELDGDPVLNPDGRFSEKLIRRINTAILTQVGRIR